MKNKEGGKVDFDSKTGFAGVQVIRDYVRLLPASPGVYRMLGVDGEVLYVGKAKSLKKRVSSYTNINNLPERLQKMVFLTASMEFITTHTQAQALLVEADLIKKLTPRYNILLKDDKSFPYILIEQEHDFPQIIKHRGAQKRKGFYYGPFPGAGDVNRTLSVLQRVFLLRNCSDNVFANRTRPCLQYHIKRCTAPCVGYVDKEEYANQVKGARDFMEGKSADVRKFLNEQMREASAQQEYERAALLRDRIKALSGVQAHFDINNDIGDADVFALYANNGVSCVQVFFYRSGHNHGSKAYFPHHGKDEGDARVLGAFIAQFYQNKDVPGRVVVNIKPDEFDLLQQALAQKQGRGVRVIMPKRGKYKRAVDFAFDNAHRAMDIHIASSASRLSLRQGVAELFSLEDLPGRIEVYDNSHISGDKMVGAMIVEGEEGFVKNAYRKFNIKNSGKSDDYAMMREVLSRRFKRALKEGGGPGSVSWPDIILIDGGRGQLNACMEVLEELGIANTLTIVGIAKGPERNAGREKFFMPGSEEFQLGVNDPVLHYLQRLRDEAHRFAIGAHRARRSKEISRSSLEQIDGVGVRRKKALLLHFGSAKRVEDAGVEDMEKVEGISRFMAQKIYDYFHTD